MKRRTNIINNRLKAKITNNYDSNINTDNNNIEDKNNNNN